MDETVPNKKYYPSHGSSVSLKLRNGEEAAVTIDNFSIVGDKISFRVQFTSAIVEKIFKDARIINILKTKFNKHVKSITEEDLLRITELTMDPVKDAELPLDLNGIEKLTNLQKFTAENCKITDISPLKTLTKLTYLKLYNNNITDISALSDLKLLRTLTLRGNLISDYSPVSSYYKRLTTKDFSLNKLDDIHFRVVNYNINGEALIISANLSDTIPKDLYYQFEEYTDAGTLAKKSELNRYANISGKKILYFALPEDFGCEDGYVMIKGYERADSKQLCAELVIHPVLFKAF